MKNVLKAVLFLLLAVDFAVADRLPDIDRTDKVHDRRYLDSINVNARRQIRVNQVGFRPQDPKFAYVADPTDNKFKVIDANSGVEATSGTLSLIDENVIKPNMWVYGGYNSINVMYHMGNRENSTETEKLYRADFSSFSPNTPGQYFIVVGNDTSATFDINPYVFNAILENALKFFGIQRCGNTKSHFHAACHLKDGSKIGHDLTGGWHDCGDHFKPSETLGYVAYALITTYLVYKDKAEDRYGESYNDTVIVDGVPDILWEAKVGVDYIFKLYKASKAEGLIEKHDMWHTVGSNLDHSFWDQPERQDAQAYEHGGPDRDVGDEIGSYAGSFAATLAYFSVAWRDYDPVYADSLLNAAMDIYKNVAYYHSPAVNGYKSSKIPDGLYKGGDSEFNLNDDLAAGALALWYATKDTSYQFDLYKDLKIHDNRVNYGNNNEPGDAGAYFRGGFLGVLSGFYPGGWMTDYENVHTYVLFSFLKLILANKDTALTYNVGELERDTLIQRATNALRRATADGTKGDKIIWENRWGTIHAVPPYDILYPTAWGLNRYNMGAANAVFMLSEVLPEGPEKQAYFNLALENIYYTLGANPWDISFLMGAGDKNQNHPHNRTSNPDGYDAGGTPYKYRCPRGALMGGYFPDMTLEDYWEDYTKTETCIDFSAQLLIPVQRLAEVLPPDNDGPLFSNIQGTPITETSAVVSWDADEIALVTVFYNTTPDENGAKSVQQAKASKGGSVTLEDLEMGKTYYFYLKGVDTKHNVTTDNNHGQWYQFTMTNVEPKISGVTICQVDNRSAKIYWWTDVRSNGVVKYGTSMSALNETQTSTDGAVLFHEVMLTNLQAGTTYYFTVSSGMSSPEDNGGSGYSFTTEAEATYADLVITIKPSAYQDTNECNRTKGWKNCSEFIVEIDNNDTLVFEDFELRLYLGANASAGTPVNNLSHVFDGKGKDQGNWSTPLATFGPQTADASGQYYLPITIKDKLYVSGRIIFQIKWYGLTFGDLSGDGWSLRPHLDPDDPEAFEGVDLTKAPYFIGSETAQLETFPNGDTLPAFVENPYIPVYYHGKHIFGYSPEDTPESGPQVHRSVALNFEEPFKSPYFSVEKEDYKTTYKGYSKVTPTGFLDDLEMNGGKQNFKYYPSTRRDSIRFEKRDTVLAYGNNYMEWVSWHNHAAGKSDYTGENKYDCACAVVRSNVEIDTITTPPEIRYLSFGKKEYKVYQSKRVKVDVFLYDSLFNLLDTVDVELNLSTVLGNVQFWASDNASTPLPSTVRLVNGKATFYVSSDEPLQTSLLASSSNSALVNYVAAKADLVVEAPPPWPIIDMAKMIDTDCDNRPDAIQITLSNEYQENQKFHSATFVYGNDTITTFDVLSLNGKDLVIPALIADTSINTNPSGAITLASNVGGALHEHSDFYSDGMSPTLLSVSVLERLPSATSDHVYMQFSEPITSPGVEWPVQLFAKDGATLVGAPTVIFTKIYNDEMNIWEFEIPFDANGNSIVTEGMFAQLLANGVIKDKAGNDVSTCVQRMLPITRKLLPVPMTYAAISNLGVNKDGLAEHVYIEYARPIDAEHYPDQISIVFGTEKPETLWVAGTVPVYAADGMSASLELPKPFSYGITSGLYEGAGKGGANLEGAGLVMQHMGSGASYEFNTAVAEDKVGPVITSAVLNMSKSEVFDVLNIEFSETVATRDSAGVLYRQLHDNVDTAVYKYNLQSSTVSTKGVVAIYSKNSPLAVTDGDFVMMQPKNFSAFVDKNGNMPILAPWIPITGSGEPQIKFAVQLVEPVAVASRENMSQVPSSKNIRLYVVDPKTDKLDLVENGQVVNRGIDYSLIQGAIWKIDMVVPKGAVAGQVAAWDTLRVKYNIPIYTNLGGYVNRLAGTFGIPSTKYLSSSGKVTLYVEWANTDVGIQSESGRTVSTGAYIYKAQLDCQFVPNKNADAETIAKFSGKTDFDKTGTMGIKRK